MRQTLVFVLVLATLVESFLAPFAQHAVTNLASSRMSPKCMLTKFSTRLLQTRSGFKSLGLSKVSKKCSQADGLRSWSGLSRDHHSDETGTPDDRCMQELNEAKEPCLESIIQRDYAVSEREFVHHLCRIDQTKLVNDCDVHLDLVGAGYGIIQPILRRAFTIRAVDAVEWILKCISGAVPFDQDMNDEMPILCRFYNDFIGEDAWTKEDHTIMMVLNAYDRIKAGGYGNFARFKVPAEGPANQP